MCATSSIIQVLELGIGRYQLYAIIRTGYQNYQHARFGAGYLNYHLYTSDAAGYPSYQLYASSIIQVLKLGMDRYLLYESIKTGYQYYQHARFGAGYLNYHLY